jgi:hypothetical protein
LNVAKVIESSASFQDTPNGAALWQMLVKT